MATAESLREFPSGPGSLNRGQTGGGFFAGWVLLCAFLNAAGWCLSACGRLDRLGYGLAFAVGAVCLLFWFKGFGNPPRAQFRWRKVVRRFRRGYPLAFLLLSLLAMLGGLLWAPNNWDALAYRVPRVLHWLSEGRWHWIHTEFQRLNTRAAGFEWLATPLILFTRTDRWLFLINVVSFLLLPGLVFGVFSRLGVRRRVAWTWMWLFPTGYCLLLQAGGVGNDLFGCPFVLAAMFFALRAAERQAFGEVSLAILATALSSSAKASNLPLALPVAIALLPCWRLMLRKALVVAAVVLLAAMVSYVPSAVLNACYCGDWTGARAEYTGNLYGSSALRGANNLLNLLLQNFTPPVFPGARQLNRVVDAHMPPGLRQRLLQCYDEPSGVGWNFNELQWEVNAGLGMGLSVLLLSGCLGFQPKADPIGRSTASRSRSQKAWILGGFLLSLCVFLVAWRLSGIIRIAAPYYALLTCLCLLAPGHSAAVRQRWWNWLAAGSLGLALLTLCLMPTRPLWPADTLLAKLSANGKTSRVLKLAQETYAANGGRSDALAPVRDALPPGLTVVGMITFDDMETSLWRPFGSRTVRHVTPNDTLAGLRAEGVRFIVINQKIFSQLFPCSFEQWMAQMNAKLERSFVLTFKAALGPENWCIVALQPVTPALSQSPGKAR